MSTIRLFMLFIGAAFILAGLVVFIAMMKNAGLVEKRMTKIERDLTQVGWTPKRRALGFLIGLGVPGLVMIALALIFGNAL